MQPNAPQQKGQSKNFQFLSTVHSQKLNCKICQRLMLQPIRLHRCGHTFCSTCVENKSVKLCPICLQTIVNKQKDILATRLVGQLSVRCTSQGCPWKGTFQQYNNFHSRNCILNQGGIQGWLKSLQSTISQNMLKNGGDQYNNQKESKEDESNRIQNFSIQNKQSNKNGQKVAEQTPQKDNKKQNIMQQNINSMKRLQLDSQRVSRRQTRQRSNFIETEQNLQKRLKKYTQ